ncbi:hypothetical protein C8Q73DRAFT_663623 [Cubamyces lactineus]|nr:hypothetical protein C8Q73DRAFT_663623 [Cubamyces lactineus]
MAPPKALHKVLEEIHLLKCSLLPGELISFSEDAAVWDALLETYSADPDAELPESIRQRPLHFEVRTEENDVWFDVELPLEYGSEGDESIPSVAVKGPNLGRAEQQRWQAVVAEALDEVRGSEYLVYELISAHLLPRLHAASLESSNAEPTHSEDVSSSSKAHPETAHPSPRYHALFTSHHLKSPQKRRSLSQWSHELSLTGFAKVGYPGVIYCEGAREDVEDFVSRVKSMQWLALRLRFIEPSPLEGLGENSMRQWKEFEKVGEVVEEMRRLGRESYIVEMGIGSAGSNVPSTR